MKRAFPGEEEANGKREFLKQRERGVCRMRQGIWFGRFLGLRTVLVLFIVIGLILGVAVTGQAAVIKSVQRGTATFASGQNTLPVVLTAVDPTKTIVWGGI